MNNRPSQLPVLLYVRVSTEAQADQGHSLQAQEERARAYAALYDLVVCGVEIDIGGAKTLARPALQRALARLRAGDVGGLIVAKLDRLTRSVGDLGALVEEFEDAGWHLFSVAEALDTGSAGGRLVMNVLGAVSQWEREAISERTREVLRHKRSQGQAYARVPFGYQRVGDAFVRDPAQFAARAHAEQLRRAGASYSKIAQQLNTLAAPTPRGGRWHASTVRRMLVA